MTEKRIPEELYQTILKVMPRPCVDIVPRYNGEVLLLKRRIEPLKDFWALPGGMVNKGETLKGAAIRKIDEELGLKVTADDLRLVGVANFFHGEIYGRHDICLTYSLTLHDKPEIKLDYQHRGYKWIPFNNIWDLGEELDSMVARQIECAFGMRDGLDEA